MTNALFHSSFVIWKFVIPPSASARTRHYANADHPTFPKTNRPTSAAARNARRSLPTNKPIVPPAQSPANGTSQAQTRDSQPSARHTTGAAATSAPRSSTLPPSARGRNWAGQELPHHTCCHASLRAGKTSSHLPVSTESADHRNLIKAHSAARGPLKNGPNQCGQPPRPPPQLPACSRPYTQTNSKPAACHYSLSLRERAGVRVPCSSRERPAAQSNPNSPVAPETRRPAPKATPQVATETSPRPHARNTTPPEPTVWNSASTIHRLSAAHESAQSHLPTNRAAISQHPPQLGTGDSTKLRQTVPAFGHRQSL